MNGADAPTEPPGGPGDRQGAASPGEPPGGDPLEVTRRLLARYLAARPGEVAVVDRFMDLLERRPDALERTCFAPGHLTGSAWILSPAGDAWAMVLHRKLGRWLQPGGHADGDPDLLRVARREAEEETGLTALQPLDGLHGHATSYPVPLDLDIHRIPARKGEPDHEHFDVRFLFRATDPREALRISAESRDLRWIPRERLGGFSDEDSVLRLDRRAIGILIGD